MATRSGFGIGFRRGWSDWQKHDLASLVAWAKQAGFDAIDLTRATAADISTLTSAGLRLGSVDLLDFGNLMHVDAEKRKELIAQNVAYVNEMSAAGARSFFTVVIPGDPTKKRSENYALMLETYGPIAEACATSGASLAVEGWPGGPPHYASLVCTPETVRSFLKDIGPGAGLNYDPSHLIRLRVDHLRFLKEFAPYVKHVHAKDTDVDAEALYEFGAQPATFAKPRGFGEWTWRYTIPGHGLVRWNEVASLLKSVGYTGAISVELEDENFNGTEAGEKAALVHSLNFLRSI
ncbi:MAG TPA: sugar phosphate isomerase/epimerase family protein [Tepidisphaeraceae bacterium]|nr:sugar phosphate isomerase/epimerase family protein [Tepidisphaeraceae bacterium]